VLTAGIWTSRRSRGDAAAGTLSELRRLTPYEFYALASSRGCGRGTLLEIAAQARWRLHEDVVTQMIRNRYRQGVWRVTRAGRAAGQLAKS
jgi:hypothetical protein